MTADEYLTLLAEIDPEVAEFVRQHRKTKLEQLLLQGDRPEDILIYLFSWVDLPGGRLQGEAAFKAIKERLKWFQ